MQILSRATVDIDVFRHELQQRKRTSRIDPPQVGQVDATDLVTPTHMCGQSDQGVPQAQRRPVADGVERRLAVAIIKAPIRGRHRGSAAPSRTRGGDRR
ncbi:hypothetical protein [Rhizorhapis sp. SPR117]|uniref:hypothetical protein n=1 Tax=Rhizorhapis sp. SPR117 TaxID=2912611 RepID=UPI001F2C2080|nr:hypothetical protein [Rhizorhapis sp. SPR117]